MAGIFIVIIGAAAVILGLTGISLLAVWLQGRMRKGSLPPGCDGEPSLERCRTCMYMKRLGDDDLCSVVGKKIVDERQQTD